MSTTPQASPISSPPGQEDQSARLAASAEVDQVEGTMSDEYLRACSDFCAFCDSLCEMNIRAIKAGKPFDDPSRFLEAIELMQSFVRFQELNA